MTLKFFTFGGSHFWEDVFFYQKWRIQRNCESKKYRLLDSWDIVRAQGTFEECRRAFIKYIDIYQLPRQKGHMIIMLHGLGGNKNIFKPLWREAVKKGYLAAAINYPSTEKNLAEHTKQIEFLLNNLEDVKQVSFVTLGVGALLLREVFAKNSVWKERIKTRRVVEVCPPNQGSALISYLSSFRLFRWILGPMSEELSEEMVKKIPNLPENIDAGVIFCQHPAQKLENFYLRKIKNISPSRDESKNNGMKAMIEVKNNKLNVFANRKIVYAVLNFLDRGKFK